MKKGVNSWMLGRKSLAEMVRDVKNAGFEGLELQLYEHGEINPASTESELREIRKMIEGEGLSTYCLSCAHFFEYNFTMNDPAKRKKAVQLVKKQLETAAVLGCGSILVIPGAVGLDFVPGYEAVDYEAAYDRTREALFELAPVAEGCRVNLGVENIWNKFLLSPLEMRGLIDEIGNPYVGSFLDIGNTLLTGYPDQWIRILGKRIKCVHLKDFRRSVGTIDGFVDLLSGDVDYRAVAGALEGIGYDGWLTAEISPNPAYPEQVLDNTSSAMDRILGRV